MIKLILKNKLNQNSIQYLINYIIYDLIINKILFISRIDNDLQLNQT